LGDNPENITTEQSDDQSQFLGQLVGEGKKYSSPEELAKAYFHANGFIDHLKSESGQLREQLDKYMTLEEILKTQQVNQPQEKTEQESAPETQPTPAKAETPSAADDLGAQVRKILNEETEASRTKANLDQVADRIMKVYGDTDKAAAEIDAKAKSLGLSKQFLLDIAAKSPNAFYDLVGFSEAQKTNTGGTKGNLNTGAVATHLPAHSTGVKPGTFAYFEEIRRTNPRLYNSAKVQNEMFAARVASSGDDFYKV
jgi:hypothetical protein